MKNPFFQLRQREHRNRKFETIGFGWISKHERFSTDPVSRLLRKPEPCFGNCNESSSTEQRKRMVKHLSLSSEKMNLQSHPPPRMNAEKQMLPRKSQIIETCALAYHIDIEPCERPGSRDPAEHAILGCRAGSNLSFSITRHTEP